MFIKQIEVNLTARRFKVTASSKMHLDLSTASIGAALLGTPWIPAHITALDSMLSWLPKNCCSQSTCQSAFTQSCLTVLEC